MEKLLSEMKVENKYNRTIRKEDLVIGLEYTIKAMKSATAKYGKKIVIFIDFKGGTVGKLKKFAKGKGYWKKRER